jgi:hypothetical protein
MNKLKCYVGLNSKFVMLEKFPNDEYHAGLNDMLEDFIGWDDILTDNPIPIGMYELEFEVEQDINFNPDKDMSDAYLSIKSYRKLA